MRRRAVIYVRVSTKEQTQNLSLTTQERACRDYCVRNDLEVDAVFVEEGESAKTTQRTQFLKMIEHCRLGKGRLHHVVVYSLSRFARDAHGHLAVRTLLAKFGISLRSTTENIDDSPSGRFVETVLAATHQLDNDIRADRTRTGMRAAIAEGRWTFAPPIGYRPSRDAAGKRTIAPDPERAPLVARAFEIYGTGLHSRRRVLEMVTAEGLRTVRDEKVSPQTFEKMLRNEIYAGTMTVPTWGPQRWPGAFEPIISQEVFGRVQAVLSGKALTATPRQRDHADFPLRRFVRCASCKVPITGAWSTGRTSRYAYYRCRNRSCLAVNVPRARLEAEFIEYLERFTPRPAYMTLFREIVLDVWRERHAEAAEARKRLEAQLAQIKRRREQLEEAFIYAKTIDRATYERQSDKLAADQTVMAMTPRRRPSRRDRRRGRAGLRRAPDVERRPHVDGGVKRPKAEIATPAFPGWRHVRGQRIWNPRNILGVPVVGRDRGLGNKRSVPDGI